MCWYCHWGWPKPVADIYLAAKNELEEMGSSEFPLHSGPGHIVWSDCNFDSAQWCLDNFETPRGDYTDAELAIVRKSLEKLAILPADAYEYPFSYDDDVEFEDYEHQPPPEGWVMVRV